MIPTSPANLAHLDARQRGAGVRVVQVGGRGYWFGYWFRSGVPAAMS